MTQAEIGHLMESSGVGFGTSGARGLVQKMTDRICYSYTTAFLQHLEQSGGLERGSAVAIAGDLRPSTSRIMAACAAAVADRGYRPINCGRIASPAVACYAMARRIPSLMVTGSHIPDDRNGIKFNRADGEILKEDEQDIRGQQVTIPDSRFTPDGSLATPFSLPVESGEAGDHYLRRYLEFLPEGCLAGLRIGLYEHSSVLRDALYEILCALGAKVTRLGRAEQFIPVDTEAIRPEDVHLAQRWAADSSYDCIVSADGDGDRPLISDEHGNWLRGDVAGILCARWLGAAVVATPVSSNSAVERSGWFQRVIRTRIGSPFVIAAMNQAREGAPGPVVGYEANGGFLTASDIELQGRILPALPTRDAVVVALGVMLLARREGCTISQLLERLPRRFTASDRVKQFPTELSSSRLAWLNPVGQEGVARRRIAGLFESHFGEVDNIDSTDGLRITFQGGEVVHLRPSGNAPELRCYNEADSPRRVQEMQEICMEILAGWKEG
ncbi:MAG TPA: phosphomannomutase [Gammaproteobacteria bacterium]|nr:phosphomannomutase [Gammaproteobacteria bacterium]